MTEFKVLDNYSSEDRCSNIINLISERLQFLTMDHLARLHSACSVSCSMVLIFLILLVPMVYCYYCLFNSTQVASRLGKIIIAINYTVLL